MNKNKLSYVFQPNWVRKGRVSCLLHIQRNELYGLIDYTYDGLSYSFLPTTFSVKEADFEVNLFNVSEIADDLLLHCAEQIEVLSIQLKEEWKKQSKNISVIQRIIIQ